MTDKSNPDEVLQDHNKAEPKATPEQVSNVQPKLDTDHNLDRENKTGANRAKWGLRVEIAALLLAAGSMAFSGYQTLLLNKSLAAPYLSNLQERQVEACATYLEESFSFTSALSNAKGIPSLVILDWDEIPGVLYENDGVVKFSALTAFTGASMYEDGVSFENLISAISRISVFATEETRSELQTIIHDLRLIEILRLGLSKALTKPEGETEQEQTERLDRLVESSEEEERVWSTAVDKIEALQRKCRYVMVGEEPGLF